MILTEIVSVLEFQSTPPRREVTKFAPEELVPYAFQSTPPRREVTAPGGDDPVEDGISIHTSPKGGDLESRIWETLI